MSIFSQSILWSDPPPTFCAGPWNCLQLLFGNSTLFSNLFVFFFLSLSLLDYNRRRSLYLVHILFSPDHNYTPPIKWGRKLGKAVPGFFPCSGNISGATTLWSVAFYFGPVYCQIFSWQSNSRWRGTGFCIIYIYTCFLYIYTCCFWIAGQRGKTETSGTLYDKPTMTASDHIL